MACVCEDERGLARLRGIERQAEEDRENKQCQVNVNGDGDLVLLNIDGSVMGHEIYMKHEVDICVGLRFRRTSEEMESGKRAPGKNSELRGAVVKNK